MFVYSCVHLVWFLGAPHILITLRRNREVRMAIISLISEGVITADNAWLSGV